VTALLCIWACSSLQAARGRTGHHAPMIFTNARSFGRRLGSMIAAEKIRHAVRQLRRLHIIVERLRGAA
jgi:hypothetical protein